jgi:phosphatidylglycerophosphatase A
MIARLAKIFCSGFGMGYFPKCPGTFASFLVLFPVWFVKSNYNLSFLIGLITIYLLTSFLLINIIIQKEKNKDPGFIIVDEHIGQAVALIFCQESLNDYIISFILFRFFDILKPFPVNYFDRLKNSYGVLLDDIVAGILVSLIFLFFYGF